jgi:hypothetical protein
MPVDRHSHLDFCGATRGGALAGLRRSRSRFVGQPCLRGCTLVRPQADGATMRSSARNSRQPRRRYTQAVRSRKRRHHDPPHQSCLRARPPSVPAVTQQVSRRSGVWTSTISRKTVDVAHATAHAGQVRGNRHLKAPSRHPSAEHGDWPGHTNRQHCRAGHRNRQSHAAAPPESS